MSLQRDLKIAERRRDVAELYLAGHTQVEIAHKWRVTQATISYDLKYIQAEWLKSAMLDFDRLKARELARIDRLEREYWRAWYESRGAHEKTVTMRTEGQGAYTKAQVEREELAGDPRFLGGVQWCVEQRLKIFGVYTATRIDMTWREQAEREGYDADKLFSELVAAARARLDEAGGAGGPGDGETTGDQQAK